MRFELRNGESDLGFRLYENNKISLCSTNLLGIGNKKNALCMGCGAYGLNNNTDNTTKPPCLVMVDVNGDKKPNPENVNCKTSACAKPYKYSDPNGIKLTDIFSIMITDKQAIPFGVAAQKAMYSAQK